MRRERMFLDDNNSDIIAYSLYQQGSSNRLERERMKHILTRAIRRELTDRQRDCITMYYLEGMKVKDIATAMHLSRSTVTRHIQSATHKLQRIASYYQR